MKKKTVSKATRRNRQLPNGYSRPTIFARPPEKELDHALRLIHKEIESCVGTDHYAHRLKKDEKVLVAYQLVDRLCRLFDQSLAYWAVHVAIQLRLLKAHRRYDTFKVEITKPRGRKFESPEIRCPRPLVPKFDPNLQPIGPDGVSAPNREFDHLRRRFESFVITYSPHQVPAFLEALAMKPCTEPAPTDGPVDPECRQFRFGKKTYTFTKTQALVVSRLWKSLQSGNGPVHVETLLEGIMTRPIKKVFKGKKSGKKWTHPAWGKLIVACGKGMYRLNLRSLK